MLWLHQLYTIVISTFDRYSVYNVVLRAKTRKSLKKPERNGSAYKTLVSRHLITLTPNEVDVKVRVLLKHFPIDEKACEEIGRVFTILARLGAGEIGYADAEGFVLPRQINPTHRRGND